MVLKKSFILFLFTSFSQLVISQHTIKVRKTPKIEGLYYNTQKKTKLPTFFYFTKEGDVLYSFTKKIAPQKALIKLTLCSLDSTCNNYPKTTYTHKKGHIRFSTIENIKHNYFVIYDGQLSKNQETLSIRKEETNQLITVNQYQLIKPKE